MRKIASLAFVALLGVTAIPCASGQTDATKSARDNDDRRSLDRDFSDAELAVERDQCGDLTGDEKDQCIRTAWAQRERRIGIYYRAPAAPAAAATTTAAPSAPAAPAQSTGMGPARLR